MNYRECAIGVVMTGMLTTELPLWEIKNRGGLAIIQDPDDAVCPSMPVSAMQDVVIDYRVAADDMGGLLNELVRQEDLCRVEPLEEPARPRFSGVTCPECGGPCLRLSGTAFTSSLPVGHRYSSMVLLNEHMSTEERKLYEAVVALDEGADFRVSGAAC
jgi:two-component system chemotaxis response regulator CheB